MAGSDGNDAKIDAEFDRLFAVAIPTPDGLGLCDREEARPYEL